MATSMPELYVHHAHTFERLDIVDGMISCLWTERYGAHGEMTIRTSPSGMNRRRWIPGRHVVMEGNPRIMTIEGVHDVTTEDGERQLEIIGYTFDHFFKHRHFASNDEEHENWVNRGYPTHTAGRLVERVVIQGDVSENDIIPNMTRGVDDQAGEIITNQVDAKLTLYDAVKELCDSVNAGFRVFYDHDTHGLEFRCHRGEDRTGADGSRSPMMFGADLGNFHATGYLRSRAEWKTVAYVVGQNNRTLTVAPGGFGGAALRRRVIRVDATDIDDPTNELLAARGLTELSRYKEERLISGQAMAGEGAGTYTYRGNYFLGDIVLLQRPDGSYVPARVVEFIRNLDSTGYEEYPTFRDISVEED